MTSTLSKASTVQIQALLISTGSTYAEPKVTGPCPTKWDTDIMSSLRFLAVGCPRRRLSFTDRDIRAPSSDLSFPQKRPLLDGSLLLVKNTFLLMDRLFITTKKIHFYPPRPLMKAQEN
jgi:hypothetical protein